MKKCMVHIWVNKEIRRVNLYNLQDEDIPGLPEINRVLSKLCRWGGRGDRFYSVARHLERTAALLVMGGWDDAVIAQGLLHDASEAMIGDIISPVKRLSPEIMELESEYIIPAIMRKFGLPEKLHPAVHEADQKLRLIEERALFHGDINLMCPQSSPSRDTRCMLTWSYLLLRGVA